MLVKVVRTCIIIHVREYGRAYPISSMKVLMHKVKIHQKCVHVHIIGLPKTVPRTTDHYDYMFTRLTPSIGSSQSKLVPFVAHPFLLGLSAGGS